MDRTAIQLCIAIRIAIHIWPYTHGYTHGYTHSTRIARHRYPHAPSEGPHSATKVSQVGWPGVIIVEGEEPNVVAAGR